MICVAMLTISQKHDVETRADLVMSDGGQQDEVAFMWISALAFIYSFV